MKNQMSITSHERRKRSFIGSVMAVSLLFSFLPQSVEAKIATTEDHQSIVQQGRKIGGSVLDQQGEPIIGANVVVKGTTIGVITDIDGKFTIEVPIGKSHIVVSYIGYLKKELPLGTSNEMTIRLVEDSQILGEVVVVGYGTTTRRANIGAITSVKGEELSKIKGMSVDQLLQGAGSGIQVSASSGSPGAPSRIMVRGTSSIYAQTEPLWVIDGIPIDNPTDGFNGSNPLSSINPNDIESFEVLKDAAATAIYGSRGSNGVIMVTTKQGKKGQGSLKVDYNFGVTDVSRNYNHVGYVTGQEWMQTMDLARTNSGLTPFSQSEAELNKLPIFNYLKTQYGADEMFKLNQITNTNWYDQIMQKGSYHDINLSSSMGFDKGNLYLSANYRSEEGVRRNDTFEQFSLRFNGEYKPLDILKMGAKLNFGYNEKLNPPPSLYAGSGTPSGNSSIANGGFNQVGSGALPFLPVYDAKGGYYNRISGMNLAATMDPTLYKDYYENYKFTGVMYAELSIPFVKGLSLRGELSADINSGINNFYASKDLRPSGVNSVMYVPLTTRNINMTTYATYNRTFGERHNINAVVGAEGQRFTSRRANLFGENSPGLNMDFGSPNTIIRYPSGGFGGERYIQSLFTRVNYAYNDKYLAGVSYRRDGVSIFTANNRWSNFFAGSLGWVISEESFMKEITPISLLKLRASVGQTGNQNIPTTSIYTTMFDWAVYGPLGKTVILGTIGSPELTWETTNAYDIGIDYGLLDNRLNGSIGYYIQDAKDLLFGVPVSLATGLFNDPKVWANVGDMRNHGFEFNIDAVAIRHKDFQWKIGFNISTNANEVLKLTEAIDTKSGLFQGKTYNKKGYSLATYYLADYAGVNDANGMPMVYKRNADVFNKTGMTVKELDSSGNPILVPATTANVDNNRMLLEGKTALPTFYGGLNSNMSYKGFEFSFLLSFQGGNYIYNGAEWNNTAAGNGSNTLRSDIINNSWTAPGCGAKYPKLWWNNQSNINGAGNVTASNNNAFKTDNSTFHLYKGDFLRLRNIQLAYNLPDAVLKYIYMKGARVFISANNLFTVTGYKGWDVEAAKIDGGGIARNLEQGVYGNTLPTLKSFNIGASITF